MLPEATQSKNLIHPTVQGALISGLGPGSWTAYPHSGVGRPLPLVPGGGEALLGGEGDKRQLIRVLLQLFDYLDQMFH